MSLRKSRLTHNAIDRITELRVHSDPRVPNTSKEIIVMFVPVKSSATALWVCTTERCGWTTSAEREPASRGWTTSAEREPAAMHLRRNRYKKDGRLGQPEESRRTEASKYMDTRDDDYNNESGKLFSYAFDLKPAANTRGSKNYAPVPQPWWGRCTRGHSRTFQPPATPELDDAKGTPVQMCEVPSALCGSRYNSVNVVLGAARTRGVGLKRRHGEWYTAGNDTTHLEG
ncbi:hypothetical protein C8R44DRAFT_750093 [Mycena epipterygia]|nr:hypothetical protein C8R44DRAFT_750093 [Mycena epipterygia]